MCNPPVQEGGEDADAEDAEGQVVEDVGQEHLPFAVKAVLTLLISDGSQRGNCPQVRNHRDLPESKALLFSPAAGVPEACNLDRCLCYCRLITCLIKISL